MADSKNPTPDAMWRDFVGQWEKSFNDYANQTMRTPEFTQAMNQMALKSADFQKSFGGLMSQYLTSLNLPSRTEMTSIEQRLQAIETCLERISASLARIAGERDGPVTSARPARTRRPPGDTP